MNCEYPPQRRRARVGLRLTPLIVMPILIATLMGSLSEAHAQARDRRNFDANRLRPASSREGIMNVESGFVPSHLKWDLSLWFDYADDAFVLEENGERIASLLKSRTDAHVIGSIALGGFFQLAIDVPIALNQTRGGRALGLGFEDLESSGLGDIAVTPKVRLLSARDQGVDLAFLARVGFTSASPVDAYLGEREPTVTPELALSRDLGPVRLAANLAALFRENLASRNNDLNIDHELIARAGLSYGIPGPGGRQFRLEASAETFTPLRRPFNKSNTTGAEWLAGASLPLTTQVEFFLGGGTALAAAYSVPDYRFFGGLRFFERYGDADGDKIEDSEDACPDEAEDFDNFDDADGCPDRDNDGDGVPDTNDAAPNDPEDRDGFEDSDGAPDPDNDGDGVPDEDDKAPNDPEDVDGFEDDDGVPDTDNDGDGVPDSEDGAPDQPEDADGFEDTDGVPDLDNDQDGIADADDKAPNDPEDFDQFQDEDGVPDPDNDADGVVDLVDNCPLEPGTPENNGCARKQLVSIKGCRIEISQKIFFRSGRARIRPVSFPVLNNIAEVLKAQTQIKQVRVEGHTDSQGADATNKRLSQERAASVQTYLVGRGVTQDRLNPMGFGEEQPVDSNATRRGRAANRRVEFIIEDCKEDVAGQ